MHQDLKTIFINCPVILKKTVSHTAGEHAVSDKATLTTSCQQICNNESPHYIGLTW